MFLCNYDFLKKKKNEIPNLKIVVIKKGESNEAQKKLSGKNQIQKFNTIAIVIIVIRMNHFMS